MFAYMSSCQGIDCASSRGNGPTPCETATDRSRDRPRQRSRMDDLRSGSNRSIERRSRRGARTSRRDRLRPRTRRAIEREASVCWKTVLLNYRADVMHPLHVSSRMLLGRAEAQDSLRPRQSLTALVNPRSAPVLTRSGANRGFGGRTRVIRVSAQREWRNTLVNNRGRGGPSPASAACTPPCPG
jgi:hypothetical protein